jgi:uncharacterized membrane protein HdeD (DUF308 family)
MRMLETGELILIATLATMVDLVASLYVVLSRAYVYIPVAPILALYATKVAVATKVLAVGVLLMMFGAVKVHALKKHRVDMPPRVEKAVRAALYAYIVFVYAANAVLAYTLASLSVPPIIAQIP